MDKRLKVGTLTLDIAWGDRDENLLAARQHAAALSPDTDIIVMPELFATGFLSDRAQMARLADSDTLHPALDTMRDIASEHNCAVCASRLYVDGEGCFFNRCTFVEPDGETTVYDKRHLFTLSSEHRVLSPGDSRPPVIRFRGWNVSMAVCFDLRFPVWLRNEGCRYDLMLMPANWPVAREYAWQHLLIARAIENQAYYVGCNRSGADDFGAYNTAPAVYDPMGESVAGAAVYVLDKAVVDDVRGRLPFGASADAFSCGR